MSEPDISTLARRLAEQNNVDWRTLTGTGPDGKVVERDVLDYLARVMAGDEAVDPTPEPLPEGMEAWPDQDAPSYFDRNAQPRARAEEPAADAAPEPFTAETPASEPFLSEPLAPDSTAERPTDEPADELSDDIFLFDDEPEEEAAAAFGEPAYDAPVADATDSLDEVASAPPPFGEPAVDLGEPVADFDDGAALLVDDAFGTDPEPAEAASGPFSDQAELDAEPPAPAWPTSGGAAFEAADRGGDVAPAEEESIFEKPLDSYSEEFTTPSEEFRVDATGDRWDAADLSVDDGALEGAPSGEPGLLPDLWDTSEQDAAPDADGADADALGAVTDDAFTDDAFTDDAVTEDAYAADAPLADPGAEQVQVEDLEIDDAPLAGLESADGGDEDEPAAFEPLEPAAATDPDTQLEVGFGEGLGGGALEELESAGAQEEVADVAALDGIEADVTALEELEADDLQPAAAAAGLPLVKLGNVIRRHVELSALASAQQAAGLELGRDEPLSAEPFLLRAVATAVSEMGGLEGQVALADLEGGPAYRRVDDAATMGFAQLVEELDRPGPEEDELGLVVVDLSGLDVDEALLDVDVPAITLGRMLYDTQRGAHRSTLTLSGDLPFGSGSALLARVAELLEAPVRLLL